MYTTTEIMKDFLEEIQHLSREDKIIAYNTFLTLILGNIDDSARPWIMGMFQTAMKYHRESEVAKQETDRYLAQPLEGHSALDQVLRLYTRQGLQEEND